MEENMSLHEWLRPYLSGNRPSPRVGHVCLPIKFSNCGQIVLIGGADPEGTHDDVYLCDLKTHAWTRIRCADFVGRYEFGAFLAEDEETSAVYVFGGTNEHGNRSDVQSLSLAALHDECSWEQVQCSCEIPSPRTQHNAAFLDDGRLVVFGGGMLGADPVCDTSTYVFSAKDATWSKLQTSGEPPTSRHGHVTVAYRNEVYVHGGMAGEKFYDDFYTMDLETNAWGKIVQESHRPVARASHGGVVCEGMVYVFGGLGGGAAGVLGDLWKYDIAKNTWSEIKLQGAFPSPRLDFALCLVECSEAEDDETKAFMFLHGGMNSSGDVFDDAYLYRLL